MWVHSQSCTEFIILIGVALLSRFVQKLYMATQLVSNWVINLLLQNLSKKWRWCLGNTAEMHFDVVHYRMVHPKMNPCSKDWSRIISPMSNVILSRALILNFGAGKNVSVRKPEWNRCIIWWQCITWWWMPVTQVQHNLRGKPFGTQDNAENIWQNKL